MEMLSTHFSLAEMTRSATASKYRIDNAPSNAERDWLQFLCLNVLEPLRAFINRPITISSGYRCPALNRKVGGVANSRHLYGQAADIRILNKEDGLKIFNFLRTIKCVDAVLFENSKSTGSRWIHVNVAPNPRHYSNDNYPAK